MKTSNDVLAGLIAVKELEIINLKDRIALLRNQVSILTQDNNQLYAVIEQMQQKAKHLGFKQGEDK